MALRWADRVLETSTTTGTGAFTLAAAVTGYQRFSAIPSIATNDTVYYSIFAVDSNGNPSGDWETGLGTYSAANTLTRTTPSASTNGGAAVNFGAGTKWVMATPTASFIGGLTTYTDEQAQDAIGTILTDSSTIDFTYDDGAPSITASVIMSAIKPTEYLEIALSDETTALTTGDGKASWFFGYDFTITEIYIGLGAAVSSSGAVTVDVNKNGSTILSTKPSIDSGERTSLTGTAAVISTATSTKGDYFSADLDAAGAGAKGLKLIVVGYRT